MEQKLEEQEGTALNLHETYTSLQTEVDTKTKKLKKVPQVPTPNTRRPFERNLLMLTCLF